MVIGNSYKLREKRVRRIGGTPDAAHSFFPINSLENYEALIRTEHSPLTLT